MEIAIGKEEQQNQTNKIMKITNGGSIRIPQINKNGQKFYIILNGEFVAVKLIDTFVTAGGFVMGEFLCANGREITEGRLFSPSGDSVEFTDVAAYRDKRDCSILNLKAYHAPKVPVLSRTMADFEIYAPYVSIRQDFSKGWGTEGYSFCNEYIYVKTDIGTIETLKEKRHKLVYDAETELWYFADKNGLPITRYKKCVFSNITEAAAYLSESLDKMRTIDFDDDPEKGGKPKKVTVSVRIGEIELEKELQPEAVESMLRAINAK